MLKKSGILLINVLAFGLVGCGGGGSGGATVPSPNTTVDANEVPASDPADSSVAVSVDNLTTVGSSATVSTNIGDNPGLVRTPVLSELTSIDAENLGGHIVYAGPTERFFEGYSYANIDFGCDGGGTFELFPSAAFAAFAPIVRGAISWTPSSGDSISITVVSTDADEDSFDEDDLDVNPLVSGSVIVGEATVENLFVAQILQYEQCS